MIIILLNRHRRQSYERHTMMTFYQPITRLKILFNMSMTIKKIFKRRQTLTDGQLQFAIRKINEQKIRYTYTHTHTRIFCSAAFCRATLMMIDCALIEQIPQRQTPVYDYIIFHRFIFIYIFSLSLLTGAPLYISSPLHIDLMRYLICAPESEL